MSLFHPKRKIPKMPSASQPPSVTESIPQADYTEYYDTCAAQLKMCSYMQLRGISQETCQKYHIGFDPAWISPAVTARGGKAFPSRRLIIPVNSSSYIARDIRPDDQVPEKAQAYKKMKVGRSTLYNTDNIDLSGASPLIIVEGEIDVLSIIEAAGYPNVIGLGSTTNYRQLLSFLDNHKNIPIILSLDNDESGLLTTFKLTKALFERKIRHCVFNLSGEFNDPNEALVKDPDGLDSRIHLAVSQMTPSQ